MEITWNDFEKIEIRVGTVLKVDRFPKAKKPAYQLVIDFGELGVKKSSAQITERYTPEDLIGLQVTAVLNFPKKQIANFMSECLVLGVVEDASGVVVIGPTHPVKNGLKIA